MAQRRMGEFNRAQLRVFTVVCSKSGTIPRRRLWAMMDLR
jgi:hypothetical protein